LALRPFDSFIPCLEARELTTGDLSIALVSPAFFVRLMRFPSVRLLAHGL
jgi:hypothetical protein